MIVNRKQIRFAVTDLLLAAVSVFFLIGIRAWFQVCPVMGDMIMSCHWAGEVLKAVSVVMTAVSLIHIFIPDEKVKLGMDISFLGINLLAVFIPGGIINLCQSAEMACRSHAQLWTVICCIALIVVTCADMIVCATAISREKHQRKVA